MLIFLIIFIFLKEFYDNKKLVLSTLFFLICILLKRFNI